MPTTHDVDRLTRDAVLLVGEGRELIVATGADRVRFLNGIVTGNVGGTPVGGGCHAALLTPKHGTCKKGYSLNTVSMEGKPGAAGTPGAEGKQGTTGPKGETGEAGKSTPGPEGKEGPEGKPGPKGETGLGAAEVARCRRARVRAATR